jgi:hypothetical protein
MSKLVREGLQHSIGQLSKRALLHECDNFPNMSKIVAKYSQRAARTLDVGYRKVSSRYVRQLQPTFIKSADTSSRYEELPKAISKVSFSAPQIVPAAID